MVGDARGICNLWRLKLQGIYHLDDEIMTTIVTSMSMPTVLKCSSDHHIHHKCHELVALSAHACIQLGLLHPLASYKYGFGFWNLLSFGISTWD